MVLYGCKGIVLYHGVLDTNIDIQEFFVLKLQATSLCLLLIVSVYDHIQRYCSSDWRMLSVRLLSRPIPRLELDFPIVVDVDDVCKFR